MLYTALLPKVMLVYVLLATVLCVELFVMFKFCVKHVLIHIKAINKILYIHLPYSFFEIFSEVPSEYNTYIASDSLTTSWPISLIYFIAYLASGLLSTAITGKVSVTPSKSVCDNR